MLIGVSGYPGTPLHGPRNDVALMRLLLLNRGVPAENLRVLADGVEGSVTDPTRSAILAEFDRLEQRLRPGDVAYLHFSGHGSYQPHPGKQPDEVDQLFLPLDAGRWDDTTQRVANALTDTEVAERLGRLMGKGAFLWLVFDSCHSGGMTRGAGAAAERDRWLDPVADLGVPPAALDAALGARQRGAAAPGRAPLVLEGLARGGGYVAFFAAQSRERTPELPLSEGTAESQTYGLFTFTLARALSVAGGGATHHQVAQDILHRYASTGRSQPTPLFEGTALDAPLFRAAGDAPPPQWAVTRRDGRLHLAAGQLHGLAPGAVLALLPTALASDEAALGHAAVADTGLDLLAGTLDPIAFAGRPAPDLARLPERSFARLAQPSFALTLRVARPPATDGGDDAAAARLRAALSALERDGTPGARIVWVAPEEVAELRLRIGGDRLWLLPASGEWVQDGPGATPSIAAADDAAALRARLADSLRQIGKAVNLLRLAEPLATTPAAAGLEVTATLRRGGTAAEPLSDLALPELRHGDEVAIDIRNRGTRALDVTALFLDARYGIVPFFPDSGEINRLDPGNRQTLTLRITTAGDDGGPATVGVERLLVLAVAAEPTSERADFTFLAQPTLALRRGRASSPDRPADPQLLALEDLFIAAGFPGAVDGGRRNAARVAARTLERAAIRLVSWNTAAERPDAP